jgi:5-methylcytosine-specific restriction protein A
VAIRPKRPCAYPFCPELVESGYCEAHRKDAPQREKTAARGYGGAWRKFRLAWLWKNPLCSICQDKGLIVAATEVHHKEKLKVRPDLRFDEKNLQSLCSPCHSALTRRGF